MDDHRFDDLTKRLATDGCSRRRILRGLGGSLFGAVLAAASVQGAGAAPGGNSACAHFCTAVFLPGPQRGQCVSDAAHGTGLCVACGANPSNYCDGACVDLSSDVANCGACGTTCGGATDCTAPVCSNGLCGTTPINEGGSCDNGTGTCQNGTCQVGQSGGGFQTPGGNA